MKKIFALLLGVVLTASLYNPVTFAQDDDEGWKSAYTAAIKQYRQPFGNNLNLADLDIDGIPELIISAYPGTGLCSALESIFTYKDNTLVKLPDTNIMMPDEFILYQNYGTGELRLEGRYGVRVGWMYNSSHMGEYYLDNGLKFKERFRIETETKQTLTKDYKETKTYYLDGNKTSEVSYNDQLNQYHIGWLKVNSYKSTHSFITSKKYSDAEIDGMIKTFLDSYKPGPVIAIKSTDNMTLNGSEITPSKPAGYKLIGRNYYKLRDIAMALKDSPAKFEVKWENNAIYIETGKDYTPVGGELSANVINEKNLLAEPYDDVVYINGTSIKLKAYTINNNNYFLVRDLGAKLGFGVGWDENTKTVMLTTKPLYPIKGVEIYPTSSTAKLSNGVKCDYPAEVGTPLYAPAKGTVEYRQSHTDVDGDGKPELVSYGNQVFFSAADGSYTVLMAHLSDFNIPQDEKKDMIPSTQTRELGKAEVPGIVVTVPKYKKEVEAGELLGLSGKTGHAHGAHVHIEVKKGGVYQDPKDFFEKW